MQRSTMTRRMCALTAWLALAGDDGLQAVEPTEIVTGKHQRTNAQSVAVSPDGRLVAAAYGGTSIKELQKTLADRGGIAVWQVDTGRRVSFADTEKDVVALQFTADSEAVLSSQIAWSEGGDYNSIRLIDAATGKRSQAWRSAWREFVTAASPTVDRLLMSGINKDLGCVVSKRSWLALPNLTFEQRDQWDRIPGITKLTVGKPNELLAAAFSPDGVALATFHSLVQDRAYERKYLTVWDTDRFQVRGHLESEELRGCSSVTIAPGGKLVATGHRKGIVRVWDIDRKELLQTLSLPVEGTARPLFAPDGKELAVLTQWAIYETGKDVLPRRPR